MRVRSVYAWVVGLGGAKSAGGGQNCREQKMTVREDIRTLDDLRAEIDGIDDALHDLVMRRARLTDEIARVKRPAMTGTMPLALRPAREAKILRRLLGRHKGSLPPEIVVGLWRAIMAASLQSQTPFRIHAYVPDTATGGAHESDLAVADLAHAYFGAQTPLHAHKHVSHVVHACAEEPLSLGIVPLPDDEDGAPWWTQLAPAGQAGVRVACKLPFILHGDAVAPVYVIGAIEQEASGDDTTMLLLEVAEELSHARLTTLLKAAQIDARVAAQAKAAKGAPAQLLLEASGFMAHDDARLAALRAESGGVVARAVTVGGFANPIIKPAGAGR